MRILPVLEKLALVHYAQNSFNYPAVVLSEFENIYIIKYLLKKIMFANFYFFFCRVKFGAPLNEVCKNDIPGPLLVNNNKWNRPFFHCKMRIF